MFATAVATPALARFASRDDARSRPRVARRVVLGKPVLRASAGAEVSLPASAVRPLRMIVLRHSDSCTEDQSLKDHDRPLTAWGRNAAAALCEGVREAGWCDPDLVLCSASTRSRETLAAMQQVHAPLKDARVIFMGSLYAVAAMDGVTADHLRETIVEAAAAGDAIRTVMCVGHNKGWEEAASEFTGCEVTLKVANAALLECENEDVTLSWAKAFDKENPAGWKLFGVQKHGLPDPAKPEETRGWGDGSPAPA